MKKYLSMILAAAALMSVSCDKEQKISEPSSIVDGGEIITLTVRADLPVIEPVSKLSMEPAVSKKMQWDGGETMYVLAGAVDGGVLTQKVFTLTGGTGVDLGVFTGTLDFSDTSLGMSDIKAVVISHTTPALEYVSSAIRVNVPNVQTISQAEDGVLNGEYAIAYAMVKSSNFISSGGGYELNGVSLKYARPVVKLTIYDSGAAYTTLKLKKVALYGKWIYGATRINMSGVASGAQSANHVTVNLPETDVIPLDKANGLTTFVPVGAPTTHQLLYCTITLTDGAEDTVIYKVLDPDGYSQALASGKLYNISINLSGNTSTTSGTVYSTDGGTTWNKNLPTSEFASLAVAKVGGNSLTTEEFTAIATAMASHAATGGADLDLSRATCAENKFPRVFGNTDSDATTTTSLSIKSIVLPSNITTINNEAFRACQNLQSCGGMDKVTAFGSYCFKGCSSLSSIDLSAAKNLYAYAFQNCTAITGTVTIPSTVTTFGIYVFNNCKNISGIVNNATITAGNDNGRTFAFSATGVAQTQHVTVTVGNTVQHIRGREFLWNTNVEKLICEGSPSFGYGFIGGASNLKTIELHGASVPGTYIKDPATYPTYKLSPSEATAPVPTSGTIYIPSTASADDYTAVSPWKELVNNYSWTITNGAW